MSDISEKFPFFVCEENDEIIGLAYAHQFNRSENGATGNKIVLTYRPHLKTLIEMKILMSVNFFVFL
ncbi:MAG: hypothetical protein LBB94_06980 [Clostridiales bacterium]|nr:hypothetical protein [Clostridiales bacterium]